MRVKTRYRGGRKRKPNSSYIQALLQLVRSLFQLLTPKQWLALFLLLNIGASYAANAMPANHHPSKTPKDNETLKKQREKQITATCTNSTMRIFNKAPVKIDVRNGNYYPKSCIESGRFTCNQKNQCKLDIESTNQKCRDDLLKIKLFKQDDKAIDQLRNKVDAEYDPWKKSLKEKCKTLDKSLAKENKLVEFYELINAIAHLKESMVIARVAKTANAGCCEEHARKAEIELFLQNQIQQLGLYTARITLNSSITGRGHTFLLVDDKPFELRYGVKGLNKVTEALKSLSGTICDTWNHEDGAALVTIQDNKNGLYNHEALFDEIYVLPTPSSLEQSQLYKNEEASKLICDEIEALELPAKPASCVLFQPATPITKQKCENDDCKLVLS